MGLSHALLAALSQEALSGYDLARRFDGSLGYFWQASHQQIYRELARLSEQSLLSVKLQPQQKRPDRKVYCLTQADKEALVSWLQTQVQPPQQRDDLLVKLYAGRWTQPTQLIEELMHHQRLHQQKYETYRQIEQTYFADTSLSYADTCIKLTLDYGLAYEQNWIKWCEQALARLAAFAEQGSA